MVPRQSARWVVIRPSSVPPGRSSSRPTRSTTACAECGKDRRTAILLKMATRKRRLSKDEGSALGVVFRLKGSQARASHLRTGFPTEDSIRVQSSKVNPIVERRSPWR
jgi:hypothetical protein